MDSLGRLLSGVQPSVDDIKMAQKFIPVVRSHLQTRSQMRKRNSTQPVVESFPGIKELEGYFSNLVKNLGHHEHSVSAKKLKTELLSDFDLSSVETSGLFICSSM